MAARSVKGERVHLACLCAVWVLQPHGRAPCHLSWNRDARPPDSRACLTCDTVRVELALITGA